MRNSQTEEGWWGDDWIRWKGRGGSGVRRNVREEEEGIPGGVREDGPGLQEGEREGFRGNVGEEVGRSLECREGWAARRWPEMGRKGRAEGEVHGGDDGGAAVWRRRRRRPEAAAASR